MSYNIIPTKGKKIQLKPRKRFPYHEFLTLLLQGEDVFVEVNRKIAYYLKRRLNELSKSLGLDILIEAYPCIFECDGKTLNGYTFKMVKYKDGGVNLVDRVALVNEIKKLLKRAETELDFLEKQPPDKSVTILKKIVKARIETLKEVIKLIEEF